MHSGRSLVPLLALILGPAACTGASASPSGPTVASAPPASASAAASETVPSDGPSATVEPIPSADLGPFTCELPIVEDPTVPIANIADVRVGEHAAYDRVVFEFEQGTPELTLDRASPPFTEDASGLPIDVEGDSFLRLTMRGGTRQTDEGTSSYDGPTDFDPTFATLTDLVEGGDFERQSTWYIGLGTEACVRVLTLTDDGPPRLVIDVEH